MTKDNNRCLNEGMSLVDVLAIVLLVITDIGILAFLRRRRIRQAMVERVLGRSLKRVMERDALF